MVGRIEIPGMPILRNWFTRPRRAPKVPGEGSQGYNHGHLCLSLRAHILVPMKSRRPSAQAGWEKSTALGTHGLTEPLPPRFSLKS